MSKTLQHFLIVLFSITLFFGMQGDTFAACPTYNPDCNSYVNPYCNEVDPITHKTICTLTGGVNAVQEALNGSVTPVKFSVFAQNIVAYLLSFIAIIGIIYIIYAGFQVMTGGGDEEKTKKAKKTIGFVTAGIIIIFLAYTFVAWIINYVIPAGTTLPTSIVYNWSIIPEAQAADIYTENELDTFAEYKNKLSVVLQDIEGDLKIDKKTTISRLQNLKNLVQSAYERLPDSGIDGSENDTAKRLVDIDIAIAMKSPDSVSDVGAALSKVYTFMGSVKIGTITGDISGNPSEGNAPMTTSFRAENIKDPSGTTPESRNYIWWMRGNGGRRIELGRGASFRYTFTQEGTYTIFLDVVSSSRNSKGRIDVLPLSVSKQIEVKPKLGEIILLINGVNVSNISNLKISPNIGKMGILFDATASRAIENGIISNTIWDFGNGQTLEYKGNPIVERQLYVNQGTYPVKLTISTNTDNSFTKEINLVVRDPSAVIETDKLTGNIGEEMNFRSFSYFAQQNNIESSWQIQDDNNKKIVKSSVGPTLAHTFTTVGTYIITLTSRSPNGNIDTDSKMITIESREPIVNLIDPKPESEAKPNNILFDASKSYDPDTMSRKGLTFTWRLDGEKVTLNNLEQDQSKGKLVFNTIGTHTVSLTVSNTYGKITTIEKTFEVTSTLSVNMIVTPNVAPIGTTINFIAQSESAGFYEWDMGDGTSPINGSKRLVQHIFNKTGVYTVNLRVKSKDGISTNQTSKTVYVTDTNTPFATITGSNPSSSVYEDAKACNNSGAIIINRSEPTTFDGGESINIDGSTAGLSYTWEYFEKVRTTQAINQRFTELGCFPIKLTVRSNTNGSTHTASRYVSIRNENPELTSISTSVDATKKDAQKVLVKVTANGARDPDGVITSYIWYYTTESDKEPQNIQITQKNDITFVLPNITEKYYFGVILEDNDGGRKNSMEDSVEQMPLLIDNQDGNIYLPLISLSGPKIGLAGEKLRISADAKTIVGTNITSKAEYAWDFDGDGKIDEKTANATVEHIYKSSGIYSLKVRVTYNGVSNTKYQTITIKNPLKAAFYGYKLPNGDIYMLNASKGPYEKVLWNISGEETESLYSLKIKSPQIGLDGDFGRLTVSTIDSDTDSTNLNMKDVRELSGSGLLYQSFPSPIDNSVHISGPGEKVLISLIGNEGSRFVIDEDISIDSDLDGVTDNDADNKDSPSYTDGSVYSLQDFSTTGNRTRTMKLSNYNGDTLINSEKITIIFDYIKESGTVSGEELLSMNSGSLNSLDKKELDNLASLIRTTDDSSRIVLMQLYNILIENWDDPFTKAKTLIDIQEKVDELNLSSSLQDSFGKSIDALLIGDSTSTDDITIAAKLIEGLIPESSENRTVILEKLATIKSHPQLLAENKILAKDILKMIEVDSTIETKYKLHIKNQLQIIVNGGQSSDPLDTSATTEEKPWSILGFMIGFIKIFFLIIGILIGVILIGYIFYRVSRKNNDIGFQDFLIDSVFHTRGKPVSSTIIKTTPVEEAKAVPNPPIVDPLVASYTPPTPLSVNDPLGNIDQRSYIDPLKAQTYETTSNSVAGEGNDILLGSGASENIPASGDLSKEDVQNTTEVLVPDWLKAPTLDTEEVEVISQETQNTETQSSPVIESTENLESMIVNEEPMKAEGEPMTVEIDPIISPVTHTKAEEENSEDILLVKDTPSEDTIGQELVTQKEEVTKEEEQNQIANIVIDTPKEKTPPPPIVRDANMPDWLSIDPLPNTQTIDEEISKEEDLDLVISNDTIEEVKNESIIEEKKGNENDVLPDWLVQSAQGTGASSESVDDTSSESLLDMIDNDTDDTTVQKSAKKKGISSKKNQKGVKTGEEKKSDQHDNIPDWLK